MLAIPSMKADASADLTHLGIYLRGQNCYPETQIAQDLQKLETLRRNATGVLEASESGQEHLLHYCAHLKVICPRFSSMVADMKISVSWADAFVTRKKFSSASLQFDLACCLWNLGAYESLLGGRVDRTTDEGIRNANKHFQQAAGYFQYIQEQVLPNLPPTSVTPCFSADSLILCKQLMLSQAQLCFYEKAVKDKKKDSMKSVVIAKLAAQASAFYAAAASSSRTGSLSQILDISWFAVSDFQCKCFRGAAEYWQALASKESALQRGSGYGEEIVRYNRAEAFVRQAQETGRKHNLPSSIIGGAEALLHAISSNRQSAQNDLNTVYLEALPAESTLAEVQPVSMVKPSSLPELATMLPEQEQLFRYVLPRHIIESNKNFYEEVMSYYQRTSVEAENATNLGRTSLSSMGLPGSLEVAKSDQPFPEVLWAKVQKVQDMGGENRLHTLQSDLKAASQRAWAAMTEIDDSLAREERTSADFKQRYPAFAVLMSDSSAAQEIRANNAKLREAYCNAQANDESLDKEMRSDEVVEQLRLLSKTRDELQMLFRSAVVEATPAPPVVDLLDLDISGATSPASTCSSQAGCRLSPEAKVLEEKLHDLADLFEQRSRQVEKMKSLTTVDLVPHVLKALDNGGDVYAMHMQYSQESKDLMKAVHEGMATQHRLLDEIIQLNVSFVKSKENDPVALARNQLIQNLEVSVAKYITLHSQMSSGLTFYTNLRSKITTLQQNCDDLAYTQQWQRQEFEESQVQAQKQAASAHNQVEDDRALAMRFAQDVYVAQGTNARYTASAAPTPSAGTTPNHTTQSSSSTASSSPYLSAYAAAPYPGASLPPAIPSSSSSSSLGAGSSAVGSTAASMPSYSYSSYPGLSNAHAAPAPVPAMAALHNPGHGYNPSSSAYNPAILSPNGYGMPQTSTPIPPATYNHSGSTKTLDQKVASLVEMGFHVDNVRQALQANNGDEEAALNSLLSSASAGTLPPAASPAPPAAAPEKKGWGGIFGKK